MQHICFDYQREERIGLPEAVFCLNKEPHIIQKLLEEFSLDKESNVLFTRLEKSVFYAFPKILQNTVNYHELSQTAFARTMKAHPSAGRVAIISAGSADARVTWEAARTLEYFGVTHHVIEDCGVAGLWRLTHRLKEINTYDILIAVAGLDAALISVLGGLSGKPIFAVPTSVGYGIAKMGESALNSMLISCAQGIAVMNIDNGFGAACAAMRTLNMIHSFQKGK